MNSPIVSVPVAKTLTPQIVDGSIIELNNNEEAHQDLYSIITGNKGDVASENNIDNNKKKQLEEEINNLKQQKKNWEEIITKLKEDYANYSKLSRNAQETIMKFIEKNRVRDMLASAFVGAVISVLFTFLLTRPIISKAIDNFLWEYTERKKE